MAFAGGEPMYCLMSARSMNALSGRGVNEDKIRTASTLAGYHQMCAPIESDKLDVVMTRTLLRCFSLSSWVSSALTTRTASPGSEPLNDDDRAVVRLSTSSVHASVAWLAPLRSLSPCTHQ